jgi:hypothetical protein
MATQSIKTSPANDTGITRKRSPIDLRIHGEDVFITGRFHRWQATSATGKDLDEVSINMAVDVTSPDHLARDQEQSELLSFRADELLKLQASVYMARGELTTTAGTRSFQMLVEIPEGHTAFLSLAFVIRREEMGPGWKELVTGGSGAGGIDAERRLDPWLGVRDLQLAAA